MLHEELPIYKTCTELLGLAYEVQRQLPRDFKASIGKHVHEHVAAMLNLLCMANATQAGTRVQHLDDMLMHQRTLKAILRTAYLARFISHALFARCVEVIESVGKQGGGWKKSALKAPAA